MHDIIYVAHSSNSNLKLSFNRSVLPCLERSSANWSSGHGPVQLAFDNAICWIRLIATANDDN